MARASWTGSGEAKTDAIWFALREKVGATDFLGYEDERAEGVIRAIIKDHREVGELKKGESGAVILNQTPFYGESGGQIGDTGVMRHDVDSVHILAKVIDTRKMAGDLIVHFVTVEHSALKLGDAVLLDVYSDRRAAIRANHSATHLLHEALRQVLGDHVAQKGSLVADDRLRFDFSHPKPLTAEEIAKVEDRANAQVLRNTEVKTRLMAVDEAIESGARALFGEKYGDEVRVVAMGEEPGANPIGWSVELCGGTHVRRTGDIGLISVVAESAVGAGVRRIQAMTGDAARHHLNAESHKLRDLAALVKAPVGEVDGRITQLIEERKRLDQELAETRKKLVMGAAVMEGAGRLFADATVITAKGSTEESAGVRTIGNVKLLARAVTGIDAKDLRGLADEGKKRVGSGIVAVVGVTHDGKAGLVVGVTNDLLARFNAVELARKGAEALGGSKSGGRPDMAQAGGPDGSKAEAALEAIAAAIGG
jgi:alanyl-tRNA synthetase